MWPPGEAWPQPLGQAAYAARLEVVMEQVKAGCTRVGRGVQGYINRINASIWRVCARGRSRLACRKGQGTTEYAILVGVLVVIAIVAVTAFKDKIQELWTAITTGINGL